MRCGSTVCKQTSPMALDAISNCFSFSWSLMGKQPAVDAPDLVAVSMLFLLIREYFCWFPLYFLWETSLRLMTVQESLNYAVEPAGGALSLKSWISNCISMSKLNLSSDQFSVVLCVYRLVKRYPSLAVLCCYSEVVPRTAEFIPSFCWANLLYCTPA